MPARVILFLHGGSFNAGSIVSHRALAGNVALAAEARALLIDYRLAPEHPFPAAIEDALTACHWLLGQRIVAGRIVVAGDSAGGTRVLAPLIQLRDHGQPLPAAAVCLSPAPDLTLSTSSLPDRPESHLLTTRKASMARACQLIISLLSIARDVGLVSAPRDGGTQELGEHKPCQIEDRGGIHQGLMLPPDPRCTASLILGSRHEGYQEGTPTEEHILHSSISRDENDDPDRPGGPVGIVLALPWFPAGQRRP